MNRIHVCSLALVERTLAESGASHVMTLLGPSFMAETPAGVTADRHKRIGVSDIVAAENGEIDPEHARNGYVLPGETHVREVIAFAKAWHALGPGRGPLLIHCYAGVSRSTAAAYISVLTLDPTRDERDLAEEMRRVSPTASPNRRLIEVADVLLGRKGRMVAAIEAIGRGVDCYEGVPFALDYGMLSKA